MLCCSRTEVAALLPGDHMLLKPLVSWAIAGGLTGGGSGPSHLIPLQQAAAGTSFDPGVVCSLLPLHGGSGASGKLAGSSGAPQQQFLPEASSMFTPVRVDCCSAASRQSSLLLQLPCWPPCNSPQF